MACFFAFLFYRNLLDRDTFSKSDPSKMVSYTHPLALFLALSLCLSLSLYPSDPSLSLHLSLRPFSLSPSLPFPPSLMLT